MNASKTSFPVTENMINDWSDNLVNQPTNIDGEPIVATSDKPVTCHGYLAAYVQ